MTNKQELSELNKYIDTFKKWKILKDIAMNDFEEKVIATQIAQKINVNVSSPYFYSVLNALLRMGAIEHIETIGRLRFLRINKQKCIDLAYNCKIFKEFEDLVDSVNKLWYKI